MSDRLFNYEVIELADHPEPEQIGDYVIKPEEFGFSVYPMYSDSLNKKPIAYWIKTFDSAVEFIKLLDDGYNGKNRRKSKN